MIFADAAELLSFLRVAWVVTIISGVIGVIALVYSLLGVSISKRREDFRTGAFILGLVFLLPAFALLALFVLPPIVQFFHR